MLYSNRLINVPINVCINVYIYMFMYYFEKGKEYRIMYVNFKIN